MSEKIKIIDQDKWNASIAHLFLGWLFLLTPKSSPFSNPFVKQHSIKSTVNMIMYIIAFSFISIFKKVLIMINIPVINIRLYYILIFSITLVYLFNIVFNIYRIFKLKEGFIEKKSLKIEESLEMVNIKDSDKTIIMLSFLPFIGRIISVRKWNYLSKKTALIWEVFTFLLILSSFSWITSMWFLFILFLYIVYIVLFSLFLFIEDKVFIMKTFKKTPTLREFHIIIYAFLHLIYSSISSKLKKTTFKESYIKTLNIFKDKEDKINSLEYLKNKPLEFKPEFLYIPFLNIFFLKWLLNKSYKFAYLQWLFLTILSIIFITIKLTPVFFLLLIIASFWIAHIRNNPKYRLIILSELVTFFSFIFRLFKKKKKEVIELKDKKENISLKINK